MAVNLESATSQKIYLTKYEHLTRLDEINDAFEYLCKQEDEVNKELDAHFQKQSALESKMLSLHSMLPNLQLVQNDSKQLEGMISFTSTLAENVSSKVRQLDLAKGHVTLCMQRVEDVLDLKFCTDGVQTALQDEDYEKAAAHIHRFLTLDENVLRMSEDASSGSTLETSFQLLHEAQTKLKLIVHNKFDAAVHSGDVASVERFFKIFPLIGQHDDGLSKFSKYLCAQLSETADKNLKLSLSTEAGDNRANVLYADTITLLFESIARVIEIHQPLVETYYGPGMLFTMIEYLQRECDRQSRKILDNFKQHRKFDRKTQQVQQCLMYHKASIDKVDPKDLDMLIAEITLLNTRTELYLRFIRRRATNDAEVRDQTEDEKEEGIKEIDQFIINCELSRLMQEFIGTYIMMEEYFMKEMVVKAVSMDQAEEGSLTSSMVDDAFFIVKKCVRRALSSSSVDGVCAMLNHACSTLEQDFCDIIRARLRQGFPSGFDFTQAYNLVQSSIQSGRFLSGDVEAEKTKSAFLTTLNNADVSAVCVQTLKRNIEEEITTLYSGVSDHSRAKLLSCLSDLGNVSNKFKDALDFGFSQLNTSASKPRIKPSIDLFLATSHNISEDDFSIYEANDPWVQSFILNLDSLLLMFKTALTTTNYDTLVSHICTEITGQLEKATMKTSFNRLGGLQYDKELRSLVGYLTSVTTWTIRDKFARLTQMATILNLERVIEILDYWGPNSGPLTWRLTPAEVRQVLSLRIDFRSDDIKRLKL